MTNEEAIKVIKANYPSGGYENLKEALDMAIQALQEQKVGKWIFGETMGHWWMKCSECCKSQDGQTLCFTYCPHCGAKMEGVEE